MAALTAYVRKTGSDNNGGSSNGASADRTGTDGVTAGTTTFTSASASFTSGDVDKLINIVTKGRYRIATFVNSTTVTLSGSPSTGTGLTWNIGGAVATIGAILANSTGAFASGDSLYIGAGTYREVVSISMTSATVETIIAGDVDGVKTGDAGEVVWTAYTTNDASAPSTSALITLGARDYLHFKNLTLIGGNLANGAIVIATSTTSTNIKFTECAFIAGYQAAQSFLLDITTAYNTSLDWTFERCRFLHGGATVARFNLPTGASPGTDYDVNVLFQNCLAIGRNNLVSVNTTGTSAGEGGGIDIRNCTFIGSQIMTTTTTRSSLNNPCTVANCFCYSGATALNAAESGAITENYNLLISGATPRTNVTAGASSLSDGSIAPLIYFGQELFFGASLRPLGTPYGTGPVRGWGDDGNAPSVDLLNRIRPTIGTSKAAGALEYHDNAVKETSTVRTGSNAIKFAGPGDHDFIVPVDATSTTITVYGRFDSSYAGTKPQMKVLNGTECGVADASVTMTGSANTWEQLSLTFTPTAKGFVTIRLISNSTDASGNAFFDDFAITGSVTPNGFDYYRRAEPYPAQTPAGSSSSGVSRSRTQ